jgi:uncharacterized phage infection (PIP) family protein YhgE
MGLPLVLAAVGTAVSISSANKQNKASAEAARVAKEVGELESRQFINEMFLGRAQAISRGNQRLAEMQQAENQNIAKFSAMGRDDRSVDAFLRRNRELAGADLQAIERESELQSAKRITEASVAKKYGENKAAGIRAMGSANYMSNMSNILTSAPVMTAAQGASDFMNFKATST